MALTKVSILKSIAQKMIKIISGGIMEISDGLKVDFQPEIQVALEINSNNQVPLEFWDKIQV